MSTELPDRIDTYLRAHDQRDTDSALTTFSDDATVVDEGNTYTGTDRIRWWLDNSSSEYTYTRTLTGIDSEGNGNYVVHNHLVGNFPGGEVDLRFQFKLADELIHRLEIAP
jgi:hypothetical protein